MKLTISIQADTQPFVFDFCQDITLLLGRFDPSTGTFPDINLAKYQAEEHGVSRRHAAIIWRYNTPQIIDLGSINGTYLNDLPILPSQPRQLRDGDKLRVGFLPLYVKLEGPHQAEPST